MSLKPDFSQKTATFALIGVAGFIAKRHLQAIKDVGGKLLFACDLHDNVGILDSYFPEAFFYKDEAEFWAAIEKSETKIDFVSICTPNHLHHVHTIQALKLGSSVICEKPLTMSMAYLNQMQEAELMAQEKFGGPEQRVFILHQLRVHPGVIQLKNELKPNENYSVDLKYITSRGHWYQSTWKAKNEQSGGVGFNIGIHFFDLLIHLFGSVQSSSVTRREQNKMVGNIRFRNATVNWFLSIDVNDLPKAVLAKGQRTYRVLNINKTPIDLSDGFTELHTEVYHQALKGQGVGITEARAAIELVSAWE